MQSSIQAPRISWAAVMAVLAFYTPGASVQAQPAPTVAEAERFVKDAEARLAGLAIRAERAGWVVDTFITDDTELIKAQADEALLKASGEVALASRRFKGLTLPADTARKLKRMQLSRMLESDADRARLTRLQAAMTGAYGKAKYCAKDEAGKALPCKALGDLEQLLAESRNPAELLDAWKGWHEQSKVYRKDYAEFVALSNKGAQAMGFADTGALWRAGYDMPSDAFAADMERVWQQVEPLYVSLHAYVRNRLQQVYGPEVVPVNRPIPAHLLGNMWSQSWETIYPVVKPPKKGGAPAFDLGQALAQRKTTPVEMVKYAEAFYTSLGMEALPATFWERSMLTKPQDREVVCHASASDIDKDMDVRVKMCIRSSEDDFYVLHHELGHTYYDLAYRRQSMAFRDGANDGFHEAIGDTIALSITPGYLRRIGLMGPNDVPGDDIDNLLLMALRKVSFLPFAYKVDAWRWQVYAGKAAPQDYDKLWWQLSEAYQGIARPAPLEPGGFDAGAKYHVAADVSYVRYFIAHILQFQFHRALCREAGYSGPLHECSIYANKKAGAKYQAMLAMGASKPWPEALKALTGEVHMDGGALLEYFAPLKAWLDEQNGLFRTACACVDRP